MNNYRFRLVLASVSLTAALTVLTLKLTGYISTPGNPDTLPLFASSRPVQTGISPYQISCRQQIAMVIGNEQVSAPRRLFDGQGRAIRCQAAP
jgi:hypothetical protein